MNFHFGTLFRLSACSLLSVVPAHAAVEQPPIIVTATRVAQTADETLASVTVITRKEIERSQAASLSELLQGIAGVNV
ncbi:MAG: TonB-dependent receptor plug domain-containing protein, partial [Gammaproteobacteria bacterium]|nr:TonB-dependent receptor plug domain-containing protein [Gammaproteobacteria bacterium]